MLQVTGLAAQPRGCQGLPRAFYVVNTKGHLSAVDFGSKQIPALGGRRVSRRAALAMLASLMGGAGILGGVRSCQRQQNEAALALAEAIPTNSVIRLDSCYSNDGLYLQGTIGQQQLELQVQTTDKGTLIFGSLTNPQKNEMLPFRLFSKTVEGGYDITGSLCKSLKNKDGEWVDVGRAKKENKKWLFPKSKSKPDEPPANIKLTSRRLPMQKAGLFAQYHLTGDLAGLDMDVKIATTLLNGVQITGTLDGKSLNLKVPTLELGRTYGVLEAVLLVHDNRLRVLPQ